MLCTYMCIVTYIHTSHHITSHHITCTSHAHRMHIHIHIHIYIYITYALLDITLHYMKLRYIALHYITYIPTYIII